MRAVAIVGAAALLAGGATAVAKPATHKSKPAKPTVVAVKDDVFGTHKLRVVQGAKVKWVWDMNNYDSHNVTLLKGPKGAKKLESPSGTIGLKYQYTFTKPGTYQLYCTIHPDTMTMTVVVKKSKVKKS